MGDIRLSAVKLPLKKMHVGVGPSVDDVLAYIPSDTLYSAICLAWLRTYGEDDMVKTLLPPHSPPPLRISSCFPYVDNEFFLPKPSSPLSLSQNLRKPFKALHFLPKGLFETIINGGINAEARIASYLESEQKKHGTPSTSSHISFNRITDSVDELYDVSDFWFNKDAGLYFLYSCSPECEAQFRSVMHILGDEGIGGKRSTGCGQFMPTFTELDITIPPNPGGYTLLSLYYPDDSETLTDRDSYALMERGGWVTSGAPTSIKRKRVTMLTEGGVFAQEPRGKLIDVTPTGCMHRVYRYGFAFSLPVTMSRGV